MFFKKLSYILGQLFLNCNIFHNNQTLHFLFLFVFFILWVSQCGFNILYKLNKQKLPKKLFSMYGNFEILIFMDLA